MNAKILQFNNFCVQNNYEARYSTTKFDREDSDYPYQCVMEVTSRKGHLRYYKYSYFCRSEYDALLDVITTILELANQNSHADQIPPTHDMDATYEEEFVITKI